jgi:hypothetical protein
VTTVIPSKIYEMEARGANYKPEYCSLICQRNGEIGSGSDKIPDPRLLGMFTSELARFEFFP